MSQPPEWPVPDAPREAGSPRRAASDGASHGASDGAPVPPTGSAAGPVHPDAAPAAHQAGGWAQQAWGTHPTWGAPGHPTAAGHGGGQPAGHPGGQPGWGPTPAGWVAQRPKPGIIPLRPIGLGEMYDGAFQAIRTNPRTMIGFSAVVIAVTALLTTVPQAAALVSFGASDLFDPEAAADMTAGDVAASFGGLMSQLLVPALIQSLAVIVVSGLLIVAVSNAVIGRRTTPSQLWARTRGRVLALIVLALLILFGSIAASALLVAPGILVLLLTDQTVLGAILVVLGVLLAIVTYVVVFYGFWSLAAPALLLENLSVISSLRRSARLVRRSFWRVVGIMLLTTMLVGVLASLISVPFSLLGALVTIGQDTPYGSFWLTLLQLMITQVGSILSGAVLYPLSAAVTALLYIDLRMRQEGLDVELMRASSEVPAG